MLTPSEHKARIDLPSTLIAELEANPPPQCCLNCDNMDQGLCVKFGPIPDEHQGTPGCPEWVEIIPF